MNTSLFSRNPRSLAALGLIAVATMFGFLLQWPTLLNLVMFPILVVVYSRLAKREEVQTLTVFGVAYEEYRRRTPAFIPAIANDINKPSPTAHNR